MAALLRCRCFKRDAFCRVLPFAKGSLVRTQKNPCTVRGLGSRARISLGLPSGSGSESWSIHHAVSSALSFVSSTSASAAYREASAPRRYMVVGSLTARAIRRHRSASALSSVDVNIWVSPHLSRNAPSAPKSYRGKERAVCSKQHTGPIARARALRFKLSPRKYEPCDKLHALAECFSCFTRRLSEALISDSRPRNPWTDAMFHRRPTCAAG
jgi:hypothetical protein